MKSLCTLGLSMLALTLWGCGGGSGTPQLNSPLEQGRAALTQLASSQKPTTTQTLQSAWELFQQAVQQDPNSSLAHFGDAVMLTGIVGHQADGYDELPPPPPAPSSGGMGAGFPANPTDLWEVPPAPPGNSTTPLPIPPTHVLGIFWNLQTSLTNPYVLLNMLAPITDIRFGMIPFFGYQADNTTRRQQMLDRLNTVLQHLEKVEADPNFTIALPNPVQTDQTLTVGLPEVYLFDAYVNSLRAEVALSLAYIRDTGKNSTLLPPVTANLTGSNVTFPIPVVSDNNHDGKLTPDEYLAPSPFLTLRDPALLLTAQQAMLALVDKAKKGITGVLARSEGQAFFLTNTPTLRNELTAIRDTVLPLIQQAATGPITLQVPSYEVVPLIVKPGTGPQAGKGSLQLEPIFNLRPVWGEAPPPPPKIAIEAVTINLAAWFAHPPADLKLFAPTLTLDANGWPQLDKNTYPDPTFGGLFPNGLPKDRLF